MHEGVVEVCHGTVRFWWLRFGPMFAAEIRRKRVGRMRACRSRWPLDEVLVKGNGVQPSLWRAGAYEGEVMPTSKPTLRSLGES